MRNAEKAQIKALEQDIGRPLTIAEREKISAFPRGLKAKCYK